VKRRWFLGALLALAAVAGPAEGQTSVALFGGPQGAKILSQTNINAGVRGDLVVTFRGDAAAGCVAHGLCPYAGTIVIRPRSAQLTVVTYRRGGRIRHSVFAAFGVPHGGYTTSAHVTRSAGAAAEGTCADAGTSAFGGQIPASTHRRLLTIRLLGRSGSLLQTRCAGPRDGDLSAASPTATVPLARLLRGRMTLDLRGTRTFASHGFAGTVTSTLTMKLGRPQSQSGNASFPPGIKTRRVRTVTEQLTLVRVRGGLTAAVSGTSNPIVCGLLDSCGLSETLSLGGGLRGPSASVSATGPARRPYADFLAALGLSRSGRSRGIGVLGSVSWLGNVRAVMRQAGSVCSDSAATGAVGVPLGLGHRLGGFTGFWRTRCPGPSFQNVGPLLGASLDRATLAHREFTLTLGGNETSSDDGYVIVAHGRLSLRLRRGRITHQVDTQPAP
jgi:hypothetical protein